mgnify:CR=1 FL=1
MSSRVTTLMAWGTSTRAVSVLVAVTPLFVVSTPEIDPPDRVSLLDKFQSRALIQTARATGLAGKLPESVTAWKTALANDPAVLLMDEPLANLDPPHQADWLQLVLALVAQGCTVVSVLHEISMALHADTTVVMAQGRITHHGSCADEQTQRAVEQVFDHRLAIHALAGQWVAIPANN